ncbi:BnaA09g02010D [Brassica napus]|uniref:BnaA09g02010D protein n=1 Tax=Brassica napus TaxID=3708 RepID=A0A078EGE3_BRANA|nr:BnaA09g02010D [Brassica napus]
MASGLIGRLVRTKPAKLTSTARLIPIEPEDVPDLPVESR